MFSIIKYNGEKTEMSKKYTESEIKYHQDYSVWVDEMRWYVWCNIPWSWRRLKENFKYKRRHYPDFNW